MKHHRNETMRPFFLFFLKANETFLIEWIDVERDVQYELSKGQLVCHLSKHTKLAVAGCHLYYILCPLD
jgi:hypothetical protein